MSIKQAAHTFKLLLLGDPAVGKTALVQRFVHAKFRKDYVLTIGMEPYVKNVTIKKKLLCLHLFDIAGSARFSKLRTMFYRGARGALITFDLTRRETFENIPAWIEDAREQVKGPTFYILVGNKNDLTGDREVKKAEGLEMAKKHNFIQYIETSALTGKGVEDAFNNIATHLLSVEAKKQKGKKR